MWKAALDEAKGQPSAQHLSQLDALRRIHQEEIAIQDASHKAEVDKLLSQEALCKEQVIDLTNQLNHLRSKIKDFSQDHRTNQETIASQDASHKLEVAKISSRGALCKEQVNDLTAQLNHLRDKMEDLSHDHKGLLGRSAADQEKLDKVTRALDAARKQAADTESYQLTRDQAAKEKLDKLTRDLDTARKQTADTEGSQLIKDQAAKEKLDKLTRDLDAANQRISTLSADLKASKKHSHDVDMQIAGIRSSQEKSTVLEGDLCVAKHRITTLTAELTAAKEHSHNVGNPGSKQVQELESIIMARDEHLNRVIDDNTGLMDGIQKIKNEDRFAWRDVARLKARVAELEKELVDSQVAYEKENNARNDRVLQLALPQASTSAPTQSSNSVRSKRSSPTSVTSSQKWIKTSDPADTDTIDLTLSDTEHGKATVQGLVPNAADQTMFKLIPQSDLPQATQEKVKGWIQKLDAYPVKTGMSPWLIVGSKVETTCAVRRLQEGFSTWIDNDLDRACMDCSKKGHPCIVIRTSGLILLPSHRSQGLPFSDPEYWIESTK